jgi:Zn-dependent protease
MTSGIEDMISVAAASICVFSTVFLHELGHALVAKDFGYDTESITLYPFGGIAKIEMPARIPPQHEIYIALAGPLVNAVLALVFLPLAYFLGHPFGLLVLLNFAMFSFNMLPSYPMDGGRVMRSLMSRRWGHEKATNISITVSRCFAWLYFAGGAFLGSPMLVVVGSYLLYLLYYRIRREVVDSRK